MDRFQVADDRGERSAQLVTGVGDEVGVSPRHVSRGRSVDEFAQAQAFANLESADAPEATGGRQALHLGYGLCVIRQQRDRLGMPQRHPGVLTNDVGP